MKAALKRHFSVMSQRSAVGDVNEVLICLPFCASVDEPRFAKAAKWHLDGLAKHLGQRSAGGTGAAAGADSDVGQYVARLCKHMGKCLLK